MDFLDRLRHLATSKGYANNMQLSKASGVPYTTLDGFYRSGYDNVKLSTLRKLADCLDCSLEYLVNGNPASSIGPSADALDLARKYDQLSEYSKKVISALVDLEMKRPAADNDQRNQAASPFASASAAAALIIEEAESTPEAEAK